MIKWYRENPLDGKQIARAIQVGIPPEGDPNGPNDCPENDAVSMGHMVPEADREVRSQPLAISMVFAVPGLPDEEKDPEKNCLSVKELFLSSDVAPGPEDKVSIVPDSN